LDHLRNTTNMFVLQSPYLLERSTDSEDIHRNPQSKTELAYFERVAKRRSRLPRWALSEIEKANTGSPSRRRPPNTKPEASSQDQPPVIDLT
jgi:hypothetical protein